MRSLLVSLLQLVQYYYNYNVFLVLIPENLIAFITGHCNNKLCLPCKLVLPSHDLTYISGGLNQSLLTSGAGMYVCDVCMYVC